MLAAFVLAGGAGAAYAIWHHDQSQSGNVSPGPVLVRADGRVITLTDQGFLAIHNACVFRTDVVVTESPSIVSVMERLMPRTVPAGAASCAEPSWWQIILTARLHAPLGHRMLLDATTGRPLTWFGQRLELAPAVLPRGYTQVPSAVPFPYQATHVPPGAVCTQVFRPPGSRGEWLAITQLTGTATDSLFRDQDPSWRAVPVRGHRGWISGLRGWDNVLGIWGYDDSLTWYEGGQSIMVAVYRGLATSSADDALLLAVARSLR